MKNNLYFSVMENGEILNFEIFRYYPTGLQLRIDGKVFRHCNCAIRLVNSDFKGIGEITYYLPENDLPADIPSELENDELIENSEIKYIDIKEIYRDTLANKALEQYMSMPPYYDIRNFLAAYQIYREIMQKYSGHIEKLKETYEEMLLYNESKVSEIEEQIRELKIQFKNKEFTRLEYKKKFNILSHNKLVLETKYSDRLRQYVQQKINEIPTMKRLMMENGHFQFYYEILRGHFFRFLSDSILSINHG